MAEKDTPQISRISKHIEDIDSKPETIKRQKNYEVNSLPNWEDAGAFYKAGFKQHAGLLSLSNKGEMFFWLLHSTKPRGKLYKHSTDGVILERGIFDLSTQEGVSVLKTRPDGWHTFTNVLAVDQPIGTGYSRGDLSVYAKTVEEV
ncbi:Cell death protease [Entomophthora muscae]|uniref:Cell death protease n=1 Tax=Entomophthora muscae TaxID=34485 RepID=A0ACC2UAC2_9FUNG|nr:Cell death protease [Entomophthora muscae]